MTQKMKTTAKNILEQYVLGKDKNQYKIIETIFTKKAEVEFQINSDKISFPDKIRGNVSIGKILSADFNKKYEDVKTYYLEAVEVETESIENQPWLVVMKEIGHDITRVGTGCYNWELTEIEIDLKVSKLNIYIHEMLEIVDPKSSILSKLQREIEYPWPTKRSVSKALESYDELNGVSEYLNEFNR